MVELGEGEFIVAAWYHSDHHESLCITNFGRTLRLTRDTESGFLFWEQIVGTKYYSGPKMIG